MGNIVWGERAKRLIAVPMGNIVWGKRAKRLIAVPMGNIVWGKRAGWTVQRDRKHSLHNILIHSKFEIPCLSFDMKFYDGIKLRL